MLTPVLFADLAGTAETSGRVEVRARTTQATSGPSNGGLQGPNFGFDFFAAPLALLTAKQRHWDYLVSYAPTYTLTNIESSDARQGQFLHIGRASIAWHDRMARLLLSEDASYGKINSQNLFVPGATATLPSGSSSAPVTPPAGLQAQTTPVTLTTLSSRTALQGSLRTDRHTSLFAGAAYIISGGTDTISRFNLPEQYGPRFDASVTHSLSRRDQIATVVFAQVSDFTVGPCFPGIGVTAAAATTATLCEPQIKLAQISEGYTHGFARTTTLNLEGGVSGVESRLTHAVPYTTNVFPTGRIVLSHRFGDYGRLSSQIFLQLAPTIDPRSGIVSNMAQAQAAVTDVVSSVVTVRTLVAGGQSLPPDDPLAITILRGSLDVTFHASRYIDFAVGEQGAFQHSVLPPGLTAAEQARAQTDFFSTFTYAAVTVRAPALQL